MNFGLVLVLLVGSVLLFVGGPDAWAPRSVRELWNLGHILYFALVGFGLSQLVWVQRPPLVTRWLVLLGFAFSSGLLIEILQYGTERDPDWVDVSRDLCGMVLALAFAPGLTRGMTVKLRSIVITIALVYLAIHLSTLVRVVSDEVDARTQFPLLAGFATEMELDRWRGSADFERVDSVGGVAGSFLKVKFGTTTYSGVSLTYLYRDWSEYRDLYLDFYLAETEPLTIVVRVHDYRHQTVQPTYQYSDRFNRRIRLKPGQNRIRIPLLEIREAPRKREMDMSQIADLSFFTVRLKQPRVLYLDRVYLADRLPGGPDRGFQVFRATE